MTGINRIVETLNMISDGIDPSTGEVIGIEELKQDATFQSALRSLIQTYKKASTSGIYAQFEAAYPKHAIIMTEGCFFSTHNKSAFVLNRVLQYKIALDCFKRPSTGGPYYEKISAAFQEEGVSFLLVSKGELEEQFDGEDPFEKYGIHEDDCTRFISEEMSRYSANEDLKKPVPKGVPSKRLSYPQNLLKELLPDHEKYPPDIANRLAEVLETEKVFSRRYRRDAECISEYYEGGRTLEEIGTDYGITRERIRQVIKRGLKKMRRKAVLSYLSGETDTLESAKRKTADNTVSEDVFSSPDDLPPSTEESISISKLAGRLSSRTSGRKKLRYADISSWLINVGDLITTGDNSARVTVPTEQGIAHGIKRAKRMNTSGIEYVGIVLEPEAQKYISDSLNEILAFMDGRE